MSHRFFCPAMPVTGYRIVAGVRASVDVGEREWPDHTKSRAHARRMLDHAIVMKRIRRSIIKPLPPVEFM